MYIDLMDVQGTELDDIKTIRAVDSCKRNISSLVGNRLESYILDKVRIHFSKELKYAFYTIKKNKVFSWFQRPADKENRERINDFYDKGFENWLRELDPEREFHGEDLEGELHRVKYPGVSDRDTNGDGNGSKVIQCPVLGEFISESLTIVLYMDAIRQYSHACGYNEEMVLNGVFAHEFFHAYHYCACLLDKRHTKQNWNIRTNYASIVKESLASWFEFWFFEQNHERRILSDMLHFWYRIDVNDYPYSGALGLLPYFTLKINKPNAIKDIFVDSLCSWRYAAEEIVGLYRMIHIG